MEIKIEEIKIKRPSIPDFIKNDILNYQSRRCANIPGQWAKGCKNYICPMWKFDQGGFFDESGYEIDHIEERSISQNDKRENLQALCQNCHSVKTKRWLSQPRVGGLIPFTSIQREGGAATMDELDIIDNGRPVKKTYKKKMELGFGKRINKDIKFLNEL